MYQKTVEKEVYSEAEKARFMRNTRAVEEANKSPAFRNAAKEFIRRHTGKLVKF